MMHVLGGKVEKADVVNTAKQSCWLTKKILEFLKEYQRKQLSG